MCVCASIRIHAPLADIRWSASGCQIRFSSCFRTSFRSVFAKKSCMPSCEPDARLLAHTSRPALSFFLSVFSLQQCSKRIRIYSVFPPFFIPFSFFHLFQEGKSVQESLWIRMALYSLEEFTINRLSTLVTWKAKKYVQGREYNKCKRSFCSLFRFSRLQMCAVCYMLPWWERVVM